ncbi:LLM class flavin-dependent oxidoreductase [Natronorarus salvus]|uniref:LLM class flavin-dependent oxidoreductase n=1 Tax=Natronorarus salvus TaxID=3117733 RepID=UPI002F26DE77
MHRGLLVPNTGVGPVEISRRAESGGYSSIWSGELWGWDAFVRLGRIAEATDLPVGTAIVNVFSRTPAAIAGAAASLARATDQTVRVGVGPSTPRAIEAIHGLEFDSPIGQAHETVELVKKLTGDGDRVSYSGEFRRVEGVPPLGVDVALYNAALGPANRRLTGRLCDGWLPHNVPFPRMDEAFSVIAEAAAEAGRDPDEIDVSPYVPSAVCEERDEAYDLIRSHVAYYVGNGPGYRKSVATLFPEEAETVSEAWAAGERGRAVDEVTDGMVEALGVAGTPEEARERFSEIATLPTVDEPILVVPERASGETVERTVEELAPAAE